MRCQDVMTGTPVWCIPSDSVLQVARLMKAENVGAVPVCESMFSTRVVGIVTDRDLAIEVVAEGRNADHTRVRDVMTTDLHICYPEDDVEQVVNAMEQSQVRRVPIVDFTDRLVGIIAQADVATRAPELGKTAELVERVSVPRPAILKAAEPSRRFCRAIRS